jgi:cytochrome b561
MNSFRMSFRRVSTAFGHRLQNFSSAAPAGGQSASAAVAAAPTKYPDVVQALHWAMGGSVLGTFVYVNLAQQATEKQKKMDYMFIHKSFGTLAAALLVPRLVMRISLTSKLPGHLAPEMWARVVANASHAAMYGFLILMPVTGVVMGYFGGNGLPFFTTTIPGAQGEAKDGKLAGKAFKLHKQFGFWMEMLFLGHLGGVAFHAARGEAILARILPFGAASGASNVAKAVPK